MFLLTCNISLSAVAHACVGAVIILMYEVTFLPVREMRVLEGELRLIDPARQLVWSCLTKVNIGSHGLDTRMNMPLLKMTGLYFCDV